MADIALYYPWTRVRDESWLKAAALHWPRLAVMKPVDYTGRESPTARTLREELGFLIEADPALRAAHLGSDFLTLIGREADALVARYGWLTDFPHELNDVLNDQCLVEHPVDSDRVDWVHRGKLPGELLDCLVETRLGVPSADGSWVALHPRLAAVYLTALAERVARANALTPVTDQPRHHGMASGWTLETLTRVLLAEDPGPLRPAAADVSALYAAVAVETVVPGGLDSVPVERIVAARRALSEEFDAFRRHLDALNDRFAEVAQAAEDPGVVRERVGLLVEQDFGPATAELERGLRLLGLEPVRAVLGLTSLALPVAVEWAPEVVGLPVAVGSAGMVAATLISSSARAREQARQRRRSAAGYLLGLRTELNPTGVIDQLRRTFRRADGP
jgi:hypothetical protein